jgi:hypothetical protein
MQEDPTYDSWLADVAFTGSFGVFKEVIRLLLFALVD